MYSGDDLKAFRSQWNHTPDNTKEFHRFRIRIDEALSAVWANWFKMSDPLRRRFAVISGTRYLDYNHGAYAFTGLSETLKQANTLYDVIEVIQFMLWTLQENDSQGLAGMCKVLSAVLDASPDMPVRLVHQGGKATLYPRGAKLLDEAVIEGNLAWLEKYPEAAKPFAEALKIYSRNDPNQYRHLLD